MKRRSLCASLSSPAFLLLLCAALLSVTACPQAETTATTTARAEAATQAAAQPAPPAAQSGTAVKAPRPAQAEQQYTRRFSGQRAFADLEQQVAFGHRVPNTPGHRACRKWLEGQLLGTAERVEKQDFEVPQGGKPLKMTNIIGRFNLSSPRRIILAAHWDTRPTSEKNPAGKRNLAIDGANDGASGVAVLLELCRIFKQDQPPVGVDVVLFDGEDYGPGMDMMFLGAKHFARKLSQSQVKSYNYGILLDMVGDKNLDIHAENHSHAVAPLVFDTAYEVSRGLGYNCFKRHDPYTIFDDHLPLIERGVKMYDFIDFNYPPWHTTEDTVDKCSADSLEQVGRTVENMVYKFPAIYGELPE